MTSRSMRAVVALGTALALALLVPAGAHASRASRSVTVHKNGRILFVRVPNNGEQSRKMHGIYSMTSAGKDITRLTSTGSAPSVSRDGATVAYVNKSQIWLMRLNGTKRHALAHTKDVGTVDSGRPGDPRLISWDPSGTELVYATKHGLRTIDVDGTHKRTLTTIATDSDPSWSPTGALIAFDRGATDWKHGAIFTLKVKQPKPVHKIVGGGGGAYGPDWSPNGKRILYAFTPSSEDEAWGTLYSVSATGTQRAQLTAIGYFADEGPAEWSPDGKHIVFNELIDDYDDTDVAVQNFTGAHPRASHLVNACWHGDDYDCSVSTGATWAAR